MIPFRTAPRDGSQPVTLAMVALPIRFARLMVLLILAVAATSVSAEQKQTLGPFEAHYVVVQSTFFSEEIAARYDIVRGRDRALVNLSFLDESLTPVAVTLSGTVTNLPPGMTGPEGT